MERGEDALTEDKKGMFRFNPGIERKTFPDYNPYTISDCNSCPLKLQLARNTPPKNQLCQTCELLQKCLVLQTDLLIKLENGGQVAVNKMVKDRESDDYKRILHAATEMAKLGRNVTITPKMSRPQLFKYKCIYGDLIGTKYEGKCPDLLIDGKWYEHEGFIRDNPMRALGNMLKRGYKQSNNIIIEDCNMSDRRIINVVKRRVHYEKQDIKEVWVIRKNGINRVY